MCARSLRDLDAAARRRLAGDQPHHRLRPRSRALADPVAEEKPTRAPLSSYVEFVHGLAPRPNMLVDRATPRDHTRVAGGVAWVKAYVNLPG